MDAIIDYRGKTPKKTGSGIPLITAKIVKGGRLLKPSEYIAEDNYDSWMVRGLPEVGDIVVTTEAPLGEVAQLDDSNIALAQRIVTLRGKKGVLNNDFLFCAMQSDYVQNQLESRASGSTVKGIKQSELRKVLLPIPPEDEQLRIANHIKSISNKLEVNRQTNQTLETIAQTLFKSWFVDFDPVKAKLSVLAAGGSAEEAERAAMCAISARDEVSLNTLQTEQPEAYVELARTAALFPSAMQESELGEIPEGWTIKPLSQLINITGGGTPKRSEPNYWNGDIPWFSVKDVPAAGNVFVIDTDEKITEEGLKKSSTKLLKKGTTIITARGTVGKLALLAEDMCMNQSCYGVNGKDTGPYFNYFNLLKSIDTLRRNTHGAVFDTITTKTFETHLACFPGTNLAALFDLSVSPMLQQIETNLKEIGVLENLRDTLLPKLLSGELTLPGNTPPKANLPESDTLEGQQTQQQPLMEAAG